MKIFNSEQDPKYYITLKPGYNNSVRVVICDDIGVTQPNGQLLDINEDGTVDFRYNIDKNLAKKAGLKVDGPDSSLVKN